MLSRRQFLTRTLQASSLVALGAVVPQFVARTAPAAAPGKDNVLVVLEMTGGGAVTINDQHSFRLEINGGPIAQQKARRRLLEDLSGPAKAGEKDLVSFVQRRQLQTLTAVENLRELLEGPGALPRQGSGLN